MRVSVVIPAYNEARKIGSVVKASAKHADEVIVVDDGSKDSTAEKASKAGARVVQLGRNMGKGVAIRAGVRAAKHDIVVLMDGDGQHAPSAIPSLVEPLRKKGRACLVVGNRFHKGYEKVPEYRSHRIITNVLSRIAMIMMTGIDIRDPLCGFRAVRKSTWRKLKLKRKRFEFEVEMLDKAKRIGCSIKQVPIPLIYGSEKSYIRNRDNIRLSFFLIIRALFGWLR